LVAANHEANHYKENAIETTQEGQRVLNRVLRVLSIGDLIFQLRIDFCEPNGVLEV